MPVLAGFGRTWETFTIEAIAEAPVPNSESTNSDWLSSGILATVGLTSHSFATGSGFPSCLNRETATMKTRWRIKLLARGSLDCFEAGELWICVQGRIINCASETEPRAYLVSRLSIKRIRC